MQQPESILASMSTKDSNTSDSQKKKNKKKKPSDSHLLKFQEEIQEIYVLTEVRTAITCLRGGATNYKEARRAFLSAGNILFLDLDSGYKGVTSLQKLSCMLRISAH